MTRDAATVERHLRGLGAAACASLVADLWAARGFETRREGAVVVATRRGESQVLYPVPGARLRSPPSPDRPVDAVVDPRGRSAARRIADAHGATLLDAADLRDVLWYGVDRAVAADLCERHLGAPPADLAPPLGHRVRTAVSGAESGVGAVLVATLAVLVVGAVVAPALTAPPTDAGGATTDGSGGVDLGAATASRPTGPAAVPGLDEDGIADLTTLATAHRRAVQGRSYTLRIDYRGPSEEDPTTTVHRDVDITVDGREYVAVTAVEGANGTPVETVYHDRSGWYVARAVGGNVTYRRVGAGDGGPYGVPDPGVTGRTLVNRYLTTPETRIDGTAERNGRTFYRVVGRGKPFGFGGEDVANYTVTALVGPDGFVVHLTATYTRTLDEREDEVSRRVEVAPGSDPWRVEVTREFTYGWIDATTVGPPTWYKRQFGDGVTRREGD